MTNAASVTISGLSTSSRVSSAASCSMAAAPVISLWAILNEERLMCAASYSSMGWHKDSSVLRVVCHSAHECDKEPVNEAPVGASLLAIAD
ncbi:hypothetical protein D3C76_1707120 [compost metagenome]